MYVIHLLFIRLYNFMKDNIIVHKLHINYMYYVIIFIMISIIIAHYCQYIKRKPEKVIDRIKSNKLTFSEPAKQNLKILPE